ncbi:hypothetical protein [Streptomyces sp. Isolate_45]|uniref:hypothetical protein n=1 Tax=Streptomyces sp. Isolate_45 TaxID=2950111 RepID=UPI002481B095|nr:hypothetical protein [Streptomyces sp. Isolate_45]MDA5280033.1 hypothetical protein [Streptomyces sp. Isolate_45]
MDSEEYFAKRRGIVRNLQGCWEREKSGISVMYLLVSLIGPRDDIGEVAFALIGCMHDAFDMSLWDAKRLSRWHVVGGDLSDAEIQERIGSLVPRELQ